MSAFQLSPDEQGGSKNGSYRTQVPGLTAKGDPRQFVQHNYTDHSNEQGDVNFARRYNLVCYDGDKQVEDDSSKQDAAAQILQSPTFPLKLHLILDKIEDTDSSMKNAISWLPHGRAFHIRNSDIFKREVLPKYFKNCKMSSFYRQINLYGFVRLTTGCETGAYYHEYFLRGRAFLTKNIIRTKVKGTKIRPTSAPEDEPNFYAMTPVCSSVQDGGPSSIMAGMPLGPVASHTQSDNSMALLAAIRDMQRVKNFGNGNTMPYGPPPTMQNRFMGPMAAPHSSINGPPLSLFDRGHMPDNMRSSLNEISRTALQNEMSRTAMQNEMSRTAMQNEMSRTAMQNEMSRTAMQNEMSRAAVHNEMSRAALQSEMSRAAVHNEISRTAMHNDMSRVAAHNEVPRIMHEVPRTIYNEAPRIAHNITPRTILNEVPQTMHDETPRAVHNETPRTPHNITSGATSLTSNSLSPSYTEELKMIAQMLRASDMRVQSKMYHNPNQA